MKHINILLFALLGLLFGCSEDSPPAAPTGPVPIEFGAGGTIFETKAPIDKLADINGLKFSLIRGTDGASPSYSSPTYLTGTGGTGGAITCATAQYLTLDLTAANFMAIHPQMTFTNGVATITLDGTQDIITSKSKPTTITSNVANCPLAFAHQMAKIEVYMKAANTNVIAQAGQLKSLNIGEFYKTGTVTVSGDSLAVTGSVNFYPEMIKPSSPVTITTTEKLIGTMTVIPHLKISPKVYYKFENQTGEVLGFSLPILARGKVYKVKITLNSDAHVVSQVTVTPWTDKENAVEI